MKSLSKSITTFALFFFTLSVTVYAQQQSYTNAEIGFDATKLTQRMQARGLSSEEIKTYLELEREILLEQYKELQQLQQTLEQSLYTQSQQTPSATRLSTIQQSPVIQSQTASIPCDDVSAEERQALIDFYYATGGSNWTNNTNWDTTAPVSEWYGITMSSDNCHVTEIQLVYNNLSGGIPISLEKLSSLQSLSIRSNNLSGNIPKELGNLSNLAQLELYSNKLSGSIPIELANLSNLRSLDLSNNDLTGSIPSELKNLLNLEELILGGNKLSGSIPIELANLSNLRSLTINQNDLTGEIPLELKELLNLELLYLSGNNITGTIPSTLGDLKKLRYLNLSRNDLTGSIPPELKDLLNLEQLIIDNNNITGAIPSILGDLINLTRLNLYKNELSGSIPDELANLSNLIVLNLSNNDLTGSIPSSLGGLSKLENFYVNHNSLSGEIPKELGNLYNLRIFDLSNNFLSGSIPEEFSNLKNLDLLRLIFNDISGTIPASLCGLPKLTRLHLNFNNISGEIPQQIGDLTALRELFLYSNNISGEIPRSLGDLTSLQRLLLSENMLTGELPEGIRNFTSLYHLTVNNNELSGYIPVTTNYSFSLGRAYSFGGNRYVFNDFEEHHQYYSANSNSYQYYHYRPQAKVDEEGSKIIGVGESITLSSDDLTSENNSYQWYKDGVVILDAINKDYTISNASVNDTGVYHFTATNSIVTELTLERNPITLTIEDPCNGTLANERQILIGFYNATNGPNWTNNTNWDTDAPLSEWYGIAMSSDNCHIETIGLNNNNLSGTISNELGNLSSLNRLFLRGNQLTGTIPPELGNLTNLILHNNNNISGEIPSELGNLTNLIELNLRNNNISGEIPDELGNLISLAILDISRNNLSGNIPSSLENLQSLDNLYINHNNLEGNIPFFNNLSRIRFDTNSFVFNDFEDEHQQYKINTINGFYVYNPQAKVDEIEAQTIGIGESITLSSNDLTSENNSYQWYKNGVAIPNATNKDYTISNPAIADSGVYYFLATNSIVTDLTLGRHPITLTVEDTCGVSNTERDALLALYDSTNGDNWTNTTAGNQPWDINIPVCDCYGVTVADGRVTQLILSNNNLSGFISPEVDKLVNLKILRMDNHSNLSGIIPAELGALTNLEILSINRCNLEGNIPPELGALTSLTYLGLGANDLSGSIPEELGDLSKLIIIRLGSNNLSGTIPSTFGQLISLTDLSINDNQLSGSIPPELVGMVNIKEIFAKNNNLSGEIPSNFGNFSKLVYLGLYNNNLSGEIPVTLKDLPIIRALILGNNQLSGAIPPELGDLTTLLELNLEFNQLSGSIPEELGNLSLMRILKLNNNFFEGEIPSEWAELSTLSTLKFSDNNFVFDDFENEHLSFISNVSDYVYSPQAKVDDEESQTIGIGESITLSSNDLTSENNSYQWYKDGVAILGAINKDYTISNVSVNDAGVYHFTATNSIVTDLTLTRHPITLTVEDTCDVSDEERDALLALYDSTNGANWTNTTAGNQPWDINTPICDWFGVTVVNNKVTKVILSGNNLEGEIPDGISGLIHLTDLILTHGRLSNISEKIGDLQSLKQLWLYRNQITSIPDRIGDLQNLEWFAIYQNQITDIPDRIGDLQNLIHLNVGINQLSNPLPNSIGNLTQLLYLDYSSNSVSGAINSSIADLPLLQTFNFRNNRHIFNDFEAQHQQYNTNLINYVYSPQAKVDEEESQTIGIGGSITLSSNDLTNENNSYQWYKDGVAILGAINKDYTISNASVNDAGVYHFTATNSIVTGLTLTRHSITLIIEEKTDNVFCLQNEDVYVFVEDLYPNGININWYLTETDGVPLAGDYDVEDAEDNADPDQDGLYTLWWEDTNISNSQRTAQTISINQNTPETIEEQWFSIYQFPVPTIADIEVYNDGQPVYWFANPVDNTPLSDTTSLIDNTIYYASSCERLNEQICPCYETTLVRIGVIPPVGEPLQVLCEGSTLADIVLDIEDGLSVVWYATDISDSTIPESTEVINNTTYYAAQINDENTISENRLPVIVITTPSEPPFVPFAEQEFFSNPLDPPSVEDLLAFGTDIKWYASTEGGIAYSASQLLVNGQTYYAEQNFETCAGPRVPVTVVISENTGPDLLGCERFKPQFGDRYVINAWVREQAVRASNIQVESFNNSTYSELLLTLLNHLKDLIRSTGENASNLVDIPKEYMPELETSELNFDPLLAFVKDTQVDERRLIVYDFTRLKDDYERTIGFEFWLNRNRTSKISFESPIVLGQDYRYPILDNINLTDTDDQILEFIDVDTVGNGLQIRYNFVSSVTPTQSNLNTLYTNIESAIDAEVTFYDLEAIDDYQPITFANSLIELQYIDENRQIINLGDDNQQTIEFRPQGDVIDGWQRITSDFTIPLNAAQMTISLKNENLVGDEDNPGNLVYFDDIRMHPHDSNMKTFVYDPVTQRLMSELDENNYATYYEYDAEGGLVRVKKETEKGIYTIQETRSNTVKNQ